MICRSARNARWLARGFSFVAVLAGCVLVASPSLATTSGLHQPPASVGVATNLALTSAVKDAKFVNQNGVPETIGALEGKTVFLFPYLTLCGDTCPFTTGNALQLRARLNAAGLSHVIVIGIDVDPYRDTPGRIRAYAKLIGANFQMWTEVGSTTTPFLTPQEVVSKNPVGQGDVNANLTAIERFLGWTVQVVPQDVPPPNDWLAPHDQLSYDINHSDGFWIVDPHQSIRFVSGDLPAFTGKLSRVLATFMGYKSNIYKNPVYKRGWTPPEAVRAVRWVVGQSR